MNKIDVSLEILAEKYGIEVPPDATDDQKETVRLLLELADLSQPTSSEAQAMYRHALLTEEEAKIVCGVGGTIARTHAGHPYQVPDHVRFGDVLDSMEWHLEMDSLPPPKLFAKPGSKWKK